mgnify:CR=1 FL=1
MRRGVTEALGPQGRGSRNGREGHPFGAKEAEGQVLRFALNRARGSGLASCLFMMGRVNIAFCLKRTKHSIGRMYCPPRVQGILFLFIKKVMVIDG